MQRFRASFCGTIKMLALLFSDHYWHQPSFHLRSVSHRAIVYCSALSVFGLMWIISVEKALINCHLNSDTEL